jgi:nucleoporin SEH1
MRFPLVLQVHTQSWIRTVLSSAGNDGRVRLWKATTGNIWRTAGYITVEQAEEQQKEGDMDIDDGNLAE